MRRGESKIQTTDYPPKKKKLETNNAIKKKTQKGSYNITKTNPTKNEKKTLRNNFVAFLI